MISAIFASVLFLGFLHFTISNTVEHPSMMQRDCPAIEGIFNIWEHSVHTYRPFSTRPSVTNRCNESTLSGKIGQILYRLCQSSQRVGCTTGISIVRLWHLLSGFSAQCAHWWVLRWFLSFELSKKFHKSSKSRIFLCISHWNARRRQRFSLFLTVSFDCKVAVIWRFPAQLEYCDSFWHICILQQIHRCQCSTVWVQTGNCQGDTIATEVGTL